MDSSTPPILPVPLPGARTAPLRRFVLVALTVIIVAWSLSQFIAVRALVAQSYLQFELQDGLTSARRLEGFLNGELHRLRQVARDWGYWNETRAFVRDSNTVYEAANLDVSTFDNLAIDLMMVGSTERRLVYWWRRGGVAGATAGAAAAEASAFFEAFMASAHGRALLESGRESSGLLPTRHGLVAMAAVPILDNERNGPPAGVLMFGRDIAGDLLAEAREHNVFDADLLMPGRAPWSPDTARLWARRDTLPVCSAAPIDDGQLGAYVLLTDLEGRHVGFLRSRAPRDTKVRFEAMGRYLLGISLLLAALFAIAVVWVLERRVLSPIAAISRVVSAVARDGGLDQRVTVTARRDELAQLGREVNQMLSEIANQQGLRDARDNALAAVAQKSEFLANMSHEIRTPMNGILGMLELVLETELTTQQQERVQTAYRSAEGLLALLNDILDFSKLEAGKFVLEAREFDVREVVENVVTLFAPNCEQKGVAISCFVEPSLTRHIGDPLRIQQVLMNLLGNAVKFTAQGEVGVEVRFGATPEVLSFVVADTGIGIAPERLTQLFQPFTQVDSSMARRYGGTGLGLAICRQLVQRMNGSIDVASTPGSGTRFACTLQLRAVPAAAGTPPVYAGRRACVFGPRDGTREAMAAYLGALGFETRILPQPADLADLPEGVMDLFVIDDTLPGTATSALRTLTGSRDVALLRLTNFNQSMPGKRTGAAREQAISKPVLFLKLQHALAAAMRATQSPRDVPRAPAPPPLRSLVGKRLLLVEDNAVNQALALGMLETYDVVVDCAESGCEALEKLDAEHFDLVLMDCQMPQMDGLEATRRWRRIEGERKLRRVPIVALTANAMAGDREACLAAGMDAYLAKPFTRALLTETLRTWLCEIPDPASTDPAAGTPPAIVNG